MILLRLQWLREKTGRRKLILAVVVAVAITLTFTSVSMYLYVQSGAAGLDLSRPGLSKERANVQKEKTYNFSSTGTLTQSDYDTFVKLYDEQRQALRTAGSFDPQVLSDESLGLVMPTESVTEQ
ncbi:hypothetical protein KA093_00270 [Candidatus Saccharibacteria bacterium]|nr:hypothetical protein [Candidatus Saccharibacteria bacterium]